ncbi:MAG: fumarylacetoacetate hydrolase family protein [Actinomycetota bacterium]|nr:fumarylacetoacetate hydrolase family protein [Actinomycetota bacterium]
MKIVRYADGGPPSWGVLEDQEVRAATGEPFVDLVAGEVVGSLDEVRLLAPVTPTMVMCVGRNYREHAAEFGNPVPEQPLLFLKPPSSIVGPGDEVVYPEPSQRVDHEAELIVVIGRTADRVSRAEAMSVVGGYTCGNDVTARDIQKSDGQWTRGKGFHTFCPLGPWVETDYDPSDVRVSATVNGDVRQDGRTRDMIFDIPFLIEYISRFTRLEVGDVIMTGTPEGVGPVEVGDTMSVEVEGLGTLSNPVVAEG